MRKSHQIWISILFVALATVAASAQSFRVQCPTSTITHPDPTGSGVNNSEPQYTGPTQFSNVAAPGGGLPQTAAVVPTTVNGAIKCQQISGGDGFMTEADGTQTFMFSFGPLSGLADVAAGLPSTQFPNVFNTPWETVSPITCPTPQTCTGLLQRGDPATTDGASSGASPGSALPGAFTWNGAVGLTKDVALLVTVSDLVEGPIDAAAATATDPGCPTTTGITVVNPIAIAAAGSNYTAGEVVTLNGGTGTAATATVVTVNSTGGITSISLTTAGNYSLAPPSPTTLTGATGTLAQLTFTTFNVPITSSTVTAWTDSPFNILVGQQVVITNATAEGGTSTPPGYANNQPATTTPPLAATPGTWTVSCVSSGAAMAPSGFIEYAFQYTANNTGLASDTGNDLAATAASPAGIDGHVDPREIMDIGVMNGNIPAPLAAFDEDDEFFLTLTNVGMIQRPDLFEQHTVHFHGYPNASSFYDGVPDASIAINIGASFTYYYLAPDAGTYFWHCHITPPEHLQMGMVGQLHVRPRQDRVPSGTSLFSSLGLQNGLNCSPTGPASSCTPLTSPTPDLRTECIPGRDILCSATMPAINTLATQGTDKLGNPQWYTYNDGDGSTAYDVEYPIQMHGFDPNFHFVGMTFNPELFVDMKDKYFLLNGRSYPDTVAKGPQATISTDGAMHYSQPLPTIINIPAGGKALLRMVNLSVTEYHTLQSVGIPMLEVGFMAKLLRDQAGNNTEFYTNSITLGGGESLDVILDASDASCSAFAGTGCANKLYPAGSVFYLYTPQLDHLSNDAENFGGMMTEVHICNSVTGTTPNSATQYPNPPGSTFGNTCN